ncbi:MAG: outer membrane protein assembly factor BamB family protein [Planctomycetota bacterium]|jgi:outer membrane protein assembly factor BamB
MVERQENMNEQNTINKRTSYQSAIGIAVVAAVFSVVIGAMLAVHVYSMKVHIPARSAELEKMKEQAKANPTDQTLADLILETDTQLRRDQFAGLYFVRRGTILLVVTLVLLVGSIIWAVSHHPKEPEVTPQGDLKTHQVRQASLTRTSFTIAVVIICSGALFWVLHAPQIDIDTDEDGPAVSLYATMAEYENQWAVFRGPGGLGVCNFENIPDTWDGASGENILWKTPIPLPGHNSPVVWDNRIFLTGATEKKQQVFCFDADSGELLWTGDVSIPANPARDDMDIMKDTGYAACTAVTDGKRVCAIFAGGDIGCFSFSGNLLWEKHLGIPDSMYGYAASLTAYENTVIIQWDVGYDEGDESKSKLIALDWQTGNSVWETHRPVVNSWPSPTVTKVGDAYQVLTCSNPFVIAYDPTTGSELYRAECLSGDIASTPVIADNKLFAIEPYSKLVAVNTENASGDITDTHILWETEEDMPDICSPVSNGQLIWTLVTQGYLSCYNVTDGTEVYTQQIKGAFQASPTLIGDAIYLLSEKGTTIIIGTGPDYKEIKRSKLGEKCYASPAFGPGRIYIRAEEHLYAIGAAE